MCRFEILSGCPIPQKIQLTITTEKLNFKWTDQIDTEIFNHCTKRDSRFKLHCLKWTFMIPVIRQHLNWPGNTNWF
jgi:hypothetical protein